MTTDSTPSDAPLNDAERQTLRRGLLFIALFSVLCIGIFTAMLLIGRTGVAADAFTAAVVVFAVIFAVVIGVQARRILKDLSSGKVQVLEGAVSAKAVQSSLRRRRGVANTRYQLEVGGRSVDIPAAAYGSTREQQRVRIRMGRHTRRVFEVLALDEGVEPDEPTKPVPGSPPPEPTQAPLNDADRGLLRMTLGRQILRRLLMMVFCAWFFAYFALEGMWGLLLIVSPAVLAFFYQVYALVRGIRRIAADLSAGIKSVTYVTVSDRQVVRRSGEHCQLICGSDQLTVDRALFDSVGVGDTLQVHTAPRSDTRLSIQTSNDGAPKA